MWASTQAPISGPATPVHRGAQALGWTGAKGLERECSLMSSEGGAQTCGDGGLAWGFLGVSDSVNLLGGGQWSLG